MATYKMTNEEEAAIRSGARAQMNKSVDDFVLANEEAQRSAMEAMGEEGVKRLHLLENAETLLRHEDLPADMYMDAARTMATEFAGMMGVPYLASPTLEEWNPDRKRFANERAALERMVTLFKNPNALVDDEYQRYAQGRVDVANSGGDVNAWAYDQAMQAGYKLPEFVDAGYLEGEDKRRYNDYDARQTQSISAMTPTVGMPGMLPGTMQPTTKTQSPFSVEEKADFDALKQKALKAEVSQRYMREMDAKHAFSLWLKMGKGFSPEANELIRRAFIGGADGFDISWDKYEAYMKHQTGTDLTAEHFVQGGSKYGDFSRYEMERQEALYKEGDLTKVDPYVLLAKMKDEEADAVIMMLGAARGRVMEGQWWKDTFRGVVRNTMLPIEGAIDYLEGLNGIGVKVDENAANLIRNRERSFLALTMDERKQRAYKFALEAATSPLEYQDYGFWKQSFKVAVEQIPIVGWMAGVPTLATMAGGPAAGAAAAYAVQGAFGAAYAAETRDLILREGGDLLTANIAGFASGVIQAGLETSKVEMLLGKGVTEGLYQASMAKASKALASLMAKEVVEKYGSLELAQAALQYGGAVALNALMETLQEGAQKATEVVAKNSALMIDGQEVRLFEGVPEAAWTEMKQVAGGMLFTQTVSSVRPIAQGTDLMSKMAVVLQGILPNLTEQTEVAAQTRNDVSKQVALNQEWTKLRAEGKSKAERIEAMQAHGFSRAEAESIERFFDAGRVIQRRHHHAYLKMVAEDILSGGARYGAFTGSAAENTELNAEDLAARVSNLFKVLGLENVKIESAHDQDAHPGEFVITFGEGDVKYTFGLKSDVKGEIASENAAQSIYQDFSNDIAEVRDMGLEAFVQRWTTDDAWREAMLEKYKPHFLGAFTPTHAALMVTDANGNNYRADVDGLISLAIGDGATGKTVIHETFHALMQLVQDLEKHLGRDSILSKDMKEEILETFGSSDKGDANGEFKAAREKNVDAFFDLARDSRFGVEEVLANIIASDVDYTQRVMEDEAIEAGAAKVQGFMGQMREIAGKMLDGLLGSDWRVWAGLGKDGKFALELGSVVSKEEERLAQAKGVLNLAREAALGAKNAQEAYHREYAEERRVMFRREIARARERLEAARERRMQAELNQELADREAAEAELAAAEEALRVAIGDAVTAEAEAIEQGRQAAAERFDRARTKKQDAGEAWGKFYRKQVASIPTDDKGNRHIPGNVKRREQTLRNRWAKARDAEFKALQEAALAGVPGALDELLQRQIQKDFEAELRANVEALNAELKRVRETNVKEVDLHGAVAAKILGLFTLESKRAYIKRRMQQYGESKARATAMADGLYPMETGDVSAPWLNKIIYGDGKGGSSPDQVAQALYDDGLISEPMPDALWDQIAADIDALRKYKQREADAARMVFEEGLNEAVAAKRERQAEVAAQAGGRTMYSTGRRGEKAYSYKTDVLNTFNDGIRRTVSYTDSKGKKHKLVFEGGSRRYGALKTKIKHLIDYGTATTGGFYAEEIDRYFNRILRKGKKYFDTATDRRTIEWTSPEGITFYIGTFMHGKDEVINTIHTNRTARKTKSLATQNRGKSSEVKQGINTIAQSDANVNENLSDGKTMFSTGRRGAVNPNQMDLFADWLPVAEERRAQALAAVQRRGATDEERKAARDRVAGRNVTPSDFKDVFGFNRVARKGAKFTQDEMNELYHRALDLCDLLDIPYDTLSLGGVLEKLNLKYIGKMTSAQYTTDFTGVRGVDVGPTRAGFPPWVFFAHEWFHALDNVLGYGLNMPLTFENKRDTEGTYMTQESAGENDFKFNKLFVPRDEVVKQFDQLVEAMHASSWYNRMRSEVRHDKGYWLGAEEMAARLFESWVANKLKPGILDARRERSKFSASVFPSTEEVAAMEPALMDLFKELKVGTEVNRGGKTLYSTGRRKQLVGVHNMSEQGLKGADELGGFAMPSIAITKDTMGHSEFGEVTLLMRPSSFNPEVNRQNKLYSRDAWTPTFPGIVNKANVRQIEKVSKRLLDTLPADVRKALGHNETYRLIYEDGIQETFQSRQTAGDAYGTNTALKAAYLVSQGETIEPVMARKNFFKGVSSQRVDMIGEDGLRKLNEMVGDKLIEWLALPGTENYDRFEAYRDEFTEALREILYEQKVAKHPEVKDYPKQSIKNLYFGEGYELRVNEARELASAVIRLRDAIAKGVDKAQVVDEFATRRAIDDRVKNHAPEFEAWLNEQYGDPILARGVRNNKDFYTPSGNRRSWDALHDPATLANVVKAMLNQQEQGGGGIFGMNPFGVGAAKFKTFKDVIKNEDLLKELPKEELDELTHSFSEAINDIANRYLTTWQYKDSNPYTAKSNSVESLLEAWIDSKGKFDGLKRELNGYGRTASDELIREFMEVMNGIAKFPTTYFEAKPMRGVGFEEVAAAIIPTNASAETREILKRRGVDVYEYEAGNEDSRRAALNVAADAHEGTRFMAARGVSKSSTAKEIRRAINRSGLEDGAKQQMLAILRTYTNHDGSFKPGWIKAPNGNPSNLDVWQWLQVRTDNFRDNFFGDWLNLYRKNKLLSTKPIEIQQTGEAFNKRFGEVVKGAVNWIRTFGEQEFETEIGKLLFDGKSVKDSLEHSPFTRAKYDALFSIPEGFKNAVYLGTIPDFDGNTITNHYFAYPAVYDGERHIVFCRARENADRSALYIHDIFIEKEIKDGALALTPDITASKAEIALGINKGSELMRKILQLVYVVNPENVSKVVDENGEPLVVYRGAPYDPLAQEEGKGVISAERYFTPDAQYAKRYEKGNGVTRAYFLNIRNLFDVRNERDAERMLELRGGHAFHTGVSGALDWAEAPDAEELNDLYEGEYDGLILDEGGDPSENGPIHRGVSYVPLNGGTQVKSATDNIGTWSGEAADVRYSTGRVREAESQAREANRAYHAGAMRQQMGELPFGAVPDAHDMLSHPALELMLSGIAIDAGHKLTPREVQRFAKDFGVSVDAQDAKDTAKRINEMLWSDTGRAERMERRAARREALGLKSPFEQAAGIAGLFADLDEEQLEGLAGEIALTRGVARGARTAQRLARDAQEMNRIRAEEVLAQSGYDAATIEQRYGIDLVDTILAQLDAEAKMSKEQIAERVQKRQEAAEKRQQDTLEEVTTVGERAAELSEEQLATWRETLERLRERTKQHVVAEQERRERAKQKIKEREAQQQEQQEQQGDGVADVETDDVPDFTDTEAVFNVAGRTVDLVDPMELVWFVEYMVADEQLGRDTNMDDLKGLSEDPIFVRNVALTLGNVINRLAEGMTYGGARERVKQMVADLGGVDTLRRAEMLAIRALNELHKSRIVASRKALVKAMIEGGEVEVGSQVFNVVGLNQAIENHGRLKVGKSDFKRKVHGDVEAQLIAIKRVLKAGDTEQLRMAEDCAKKMAAIEQMAGKDNAEIMRDYKEAQRLQAALNTYGGWNHLPIGKLIDLADMLSKQIQGELEAHAEKVALREEQLENEIQTLVAAISADAPAHRPTDDSKTVKDKIADWMADDLGNLQLVLENLAWRAKGEQREAYRRLARVVQREFAEAAQKERRLKFDYQRKVGEIIRQAYGNHEKGVKHLGEFIPEALNDKITAQLKRTSEGQVEEGAKARQRERLTYGQVLQLWLSIKQEDYARNIKIWGRDGEALKAIQACITAQDISFATLAQDYLKEIFPELAKTYADIVGFTVGSTPDYWPVKIDLDRDRRPADVRIYSPFVAAMQPRVRHGHDFDERANVLEMLYGRLNEYAHMQAYGQMSEHIVPLFGNNDVRRAIRNAHGDKVLQQLESKVMDTLLGVKTQNKYKALLNMMTVTSIAGLGFNGVSIVKQMFSFPSMALNIGVPDMAKYFVANCFDFGSEAAQFLKSCDGYKSRYGNIAFNAVMEEAMNGSISNGAKGYRKRVFRKALANLSMRGIAWADWMASRAVALGIFKAKVKEFEASGMEHAEAMRLAAVETFDAIEGTMQTGQTQHQTEAAKHSEFVRMLLQFANSPYQQSRYFWRAASMIMRGEEGGWGKMGNVVLTNMLTWMMMELAIQMTNAILREGLFDEEDDDDEELLAWKQMAARAAGAFFMPATAAPLWGGIAQVLINKVCGTQKNVTSMGVAREAMPPALSTVFDDVSAGLYFLGAALSDWENLDWALNNLGKKLLPPYRHGVKLAEGWADWEQPEKE